MIKCIKDRLWAFDIEWVPDPLAGRLLHDIPESVSAPEDLMQVMWQAGGATEEDPTPFLKTVLCRIVSIAALERRVRPDGEVHLNLMSLPRNVGNSEETSEAHVVGTFLDALGHHRPQLVGFNSILSDLKILVQRGTILGLRARGFCDRPDKPWEGVDYFARGSDWNVDLRDALGGWGKSTPSLHELAVQSGVPGKMEVDGNQVAQLWLSGDLRQIVEYNEYDALTTYLVWLRLAHFAGLFTSEQYAREQQQVADLLESKSQEPDKAHLARYLEEWQRLTRLTVTGRTEQAMG
jgi:predicted PolB exonuclease-like 3'-5' exonuclease